MNKLAVRHILWCAKLFRSLKITPNVANFMGNHSGSTRIAAQVSNMSNGKSCLLKKSTWGLLFRQHRKNCLSWLMRIHWHVDPGQQQMLCCLAGSVIAYTRDMLLHPNTGHPAEALSQWPQAGCENPTPTTVTPRSSTMVCSPARCRDLVTRLVQAGHLLAPRSQRPKIWLASQTFMQHCQLLLRYLYINGSRKWSSTGVHIYESREGNLDGSGYF